MTADPRPVPDDPGAAHVAALIDAHHGEPWLVTAPGGMTSCAMETFQRSGEGWQRVIALEVDARVNGDHSPDGRRRIRLLIDPVDAGQLAMQLAHTAAWLLGLD